MKLFLCGGGSGKQIIKALNKFASLLDRNKPILYIPLAMNKEKYDDCQKWFSQELALININNYHMVKSSLELSKLNLDDFSALFIGGGNTYKLLNELQNYKNIDKIKIYLKNGGIIFGGSAGAIIFGKDINTCYLDDFGEKNHLENTSGLNYLNDFSLLCHLKRKNFKRNKNYLINFSKTNKVMYVPEDMVIFINNKKIYMIENKKYVLFKKGDYYIHNCANLKKDILKEV